MKNIYSLELEKYIKKYKVIPRKIKSNERLKLYHKYWLPYYDGPCKVLDIFNIGPVEYYFIRFSNRYTAINSYPIKEGYELFNDYDNLYSKNIINDNNSYTGAEIKYWFTINKTNITKNAYKNYYTYLDPSSNKLLSDNKYYKVLHDNTYKQKYIIMTDKIL